MASYNSHSVSNGSREGRNGHPVNNHPQGINWDLNEYELERMPQEVITDHNSRMALHPECMRNDFMCPICLKLQSNTVTVMGCLHRFCRECIIKALSNTSKECPVCRTRLPNKRYLRPDPNFDMLISRIFPLRDPDDMDTDGLDTHSSLRGFRTTRQQNTRILRSMRFARDASPEPPETEPPEVPSIAACSEHEMETIFKPLAEDESDPWLCQTRFIKTAPTATIGHMIKYLTMRYRVDTQDEENDESNPPDESLFTLCVATGPGQFQQVHQDQSDLTLSQVRDKYFPENSDKPLELYYAYNIGIIDTETDDLMIDQ